MDVEPFRPPYHDQQYRETYFLFEHPKPNGLNGEMRNYIEEYVFDFETALLNDDLSSSTRTYTDYIDLASFADGFIMNELAGNIDAYRISTFLHKPRGEKLRFGPIWDLNIGYGRQGRVPWEDWIANYNAPPWRLLGTESQQILREELLIRVDQQSLRAPKPRKQTLQE